MGEDVCVRLGMSGMCRPSERPADGQPMHASQPNRQHALVMRLEEVDKQLGHEAFADAAAPREEDVALVHQDGVDGAPLDRVQLCCVCWLGWQRMYIDAGSSVTCRLPHQAENTLNVLQPGRSFSTMRSTQTNVGRGFGGPGFDSCGAGARSGTVPDCSLPPPPSGAAAAAAALKGEAAPSPNSP